MFETAAYHRGLQWPSAPSACGYGMPTFDASSSSRLGSSISHGHVPPQSTTDYSALSEHGRYTGGPGPLYDGRAAVRDVLFGCGRFSDPGGSSSAIQTGIGDVSLQSSSTAAFSPLSLPCVGHNGSTTSTGTLADCPPPPRLPATPYGYGAAGVTAADDRYYGNGSVVGGSTTAFPGDVQPVECGQPSTGFRAPALGLGFNPRRFMNNVIGECLTSVLIIMHFYSPRMVDNTIQYSIFLSNAVLITSLERYAYYN